MQKTQNFINDNKDKFLNELLDLLKIPSVSADPAYAGDVRKTAEFVANSLNDAGADKVEIFETKGHPIVYGEKMVDPSLPTVLVYGHYDVQPPDPVELWDSPPFEPVIKKTELHPEGTLTWHPHVMPTCDIGTKQLSTPSKPIYQAANVEVKDSPSRGLYSNEID